MTDSKIAGRNPRYNDLTGKKFGLWTALREHGLLGRRIMWLCRCDCGTERPVNAQNLTAGLSTNCGCARKQGLRIRNGRLAIPPEQRTRNDPLYHVYLGMMARCHNPKHANYPNWGARGIKVCDRWRYGENGMSGFECFKADKAPRPGGKREFSIERIENNGDYTPSNTCWVPMGHQPRNTRRNVWVGAGGEKMLLADAMRKYGCTVNSGTMHSRIANGWDLMEALTTPPFGRHKR